MTKINNDINGTTKDYIIRTYKHLIDNMHQMHPQEVFDIAIDLREYVNVLNLKELKECYLWEKKYKEALEIEINNNTYFQDYFNNIENDSIEINKEDQKFYDLFTRSIDFELAKKIIFQKLTEAKKELERDDLSLEERIRLSSLIKENKIYLEQLYDEYREYYRDKPYNKWILKAQKNLHKFLVSIMSNTYKFDVNIDRDIPYPPEFANKENVLNSEFINKKNKSVFLDTLRNGFTEPVIYAANHTNVHDVPVICKAIEDHVYIIAGDEVRNDINGLMFNLNGVDWVARDNEKSRFLAKEASARRTINNLFYLYLPEGTWNMTESDPMLPFNWGIIDIAQKSNHPIVPVVLEYTDKVCYVKIGKPIYVSIYDDKLEAINKLRDIMSTMRWDIWEQLSMDTFTKEQDIHKQKLQELGMNFISENEYLSWNEWLALLKRYQKELNQTVCSKEYKTAEGYELGSWLESQIIELSSDNLSYIQNLRKQELLNLGVEFNSSEEKYSWNEMYEVAKEYKKTHGNLDVCKGLIYIKDGKYYPLGDWIHEQKWLLSRKGELITKEEFHCDVIDASLKEYPKLDPKFEESVIYRPYTMNEVAFEHLNNINYNTSNAWLLNKEANGIKKTSQKENITIDKSKEDFKRIRKKKNIN